MLDNAEETGNGLLDLLTERGGQLFDLIISNRLQVEDRFVFYTARFDLGPEEEDTDDYSATDSYPETSPPADDSYLVPSG